VGGPDKDYLGIHPKIERDAQTISEAPGGNNSTAKLGKMKKEKK